MIRRLIIGSSFNPIIRHSDYLLTIRLPVASHRAIYSLQHSKMPTMYNVSEMLLLLPGLHTTLVLMNQR